MDYKSVNTLYSILDVIPVSIYWKDTEGKYLGCNKYMLDITGIASREEIIGKTDKDLIWKGIAAELEKIDQKVIKDRIKYEVEEIPLIANNQKRVYLTTKTPLYSSGEVVGLIGISVDITDRKIAEDALLQSKEKAEAASKAKTLFLENMRHDIRTPLTGMIGSAERIKDLKNRKQINEYAADLSASGKTLLYFLNEILESIRISTGEIPKLKEKFNLKDILNKIIALTQPVAKHKNLHLALEDYSKEIPRYLIGDSVRIHRIILELVNNALKFTKKGSVKVKAGLEKPQGKERELILKIVVKDTGLGMTEDQQKELFVRFRRFTPSYQGIYKGTGLGLSNVKQFIDDLEGEVYVSSHPNQGTLVTCLIPVKKALTGNSLGLREKSESSEISAVSIQNVSSTRIETSKKTNPSLKKTKPKILLVEDDALIVKLTCSLLKDLKCKVDVARDGKHALKLFKANSYDLMFIDLGLPDEDGCELSHQIHSLKSKKGKITPIIALSAHVDGQSKKRCIKSGINVILTKPLLKEQALKVLNECVF
jgi:two-component system, OmpR family, aerobic respiration control sensor histidine kinase ArcB